MPALILSQYDNIIYAVKKMMRYIWSPLKFVISSYKKSLSKIVPLRVCIVYFPLLSELTIPNVQKSNCHWVMVY